jgi:hypothetical protein
LIEGLERRRTRADGHGDADLRPQLEKIAAVAIDLGIKSDAVIKPMQ